MFMKHFWHRSRNKHVPLLLTHLGCSQRILLLQFMIMEYKRTEQLCTSYSKSASVICNRFLFWIRRQHSYALQYFKSISETLLCSAVLIWKVSLHCSAAHTVIDRSCKPLERLQEENIPVVKMRMVVFAIVMTAMMWYFFRWWSYHTNTPHNV